MQSIGQSTPAIDGPKKVTAAARYLEDMVLNGMAYGKILRSPLPYAQIRSIDIQKAKQLPGVFSVITAADMPSIKFSFVAALADKYPLCPVGDTVRYVGDEVAAVAAVDEATAAEAIRRIQVQYEPLRPVTDPKEALEQGAPQLHESGKVAYELHRVQGDPTTAFGDCDVVVEETYQTSRQAHAIMETRGCIANYDQTGHLTVWHQTQTPHTLRTEIARALGIAERHLRVIQPETGGGFGARLVMNVMVPIAAVLSRKAGRPVKIVNTREEEFQSAGSRYPYEFRVKLGCTRDGIIRAKSLEVTGDNGAYNDKGPSTLNFIALSFFTSYERHAPAVKIDARLIYTNNPPGAAFRGFGHAEERFAFESSLDIMAKRLEMDPISLRLKNLQRSCERICVEEARQHIHPKVTKPARGKRVGTGLALLSETGGGLRYYKQNSTEAIVKVERDGSIGLIATIADTGTGTRTVMAQIIAKQLGISVERIHLCANDTDITPYDLGTWASRTTFVCGNAVAAAARDARRQLAAVAAPMLETDVDHIFMANERMGVKNEPGRSIDFDAVVEEAYSRRGSVIIGKGGYYDAKAPSVDLVDYDALSPVIAAGCHVAEVEVDLDTGQVTLLRYVAIHDVGRILNLKGVEGQIQGGVAQGIGFALSEDLIVERSQVLNPNYVDYALPKPRSMPKELCCVLLEGDPSEGPYGAKGIGELTFGPVAPAVANAIYNAIGLRLKTVPMTPKRVWEGLGEGVRS